MPLPKAAAPNAVHLDRQTIRRHILPPPERPEPTSHFPKPLASAASLQNVVNGKSVTTVDVPLTKLLNGKYAVNIHRSAKQLKVYVVCGDITRHSAPTPTDTIGEQDGD